MYSWKLLEGGLCWLDGRSILPQPNKKATGFWVWVRPAFLGRTPIKSSPQRKQGKRPDSLLACGLACCRQENLSHARVLPITWETRKSAARRVRRLLAYEDRFCKIKVGISRRSFRHAENEIYPVEVGMSRQRFLDAIARHAPAGHSSSNSGDFDCLPKLMELTGAWLPDAHLNAEKMAALAMTGCTELGFMS